MLMSQMFRLSGDLAFDLSFVKARETMGIPIGQQKKLIYCGPAIAAEDSVNQKDIREKSTIYGGMVARYILNLRYRVTDRVIGDSSYSIVWGNLPRFFFFFFLFVHVTCPAYMSKNLHQLVRIIFIINQYCIVKGGEREGGGG